MRFASVMVILFVLTACATVKQTPEAPIAQNPVVNSAATDDNTNNNTSNDTDNYWFQLGNKYAENGQLEEAVLAYQEALKRGDNVKALHNLGLVRVRLGIEMLERARKRLAPNDPVHQETRQYLHALMKMW